MSWCRAFPAQGIAFLNCDDAYVRSLAAIFAARVYYFGSGAVRRFPRRKVEELGPGDCAFRSRPASSSTVRLALLGRHNVANALAAIAVGVEAGIPLESVRRGRCLRPPDKRGELIESAAPPSSTTATTPTPRRSNP